MQLSLIDHIRRSDEVIDSWPAWKRQLVQGKEHEMNEKTEHGEIMTAHQLADRLMAGPDVPVVINGWGSCEGFTFAVGDTQVTDRQYYIDEPDKSETWDEMGREGRVIRLDHN